MISFDSSFGNINLVVCETNSAGRPHPKVFFWIAASVTDAVALNPKGTETNLVKSVSTGFIKSKPVFTKEPRKLSNLPFWRVIFLVVPFNKITIFSEEIITFIIYFVSLFTDIPESIPGVNFPQTKNKLIYYQKQKNENFLKQQYLSVL